MDRILVYANAQAKESAPCVKMDSGFKLFTPLDFHKRVICGFADVGLSQFSGIAVHLECALSPRNAPDAFDMVPLGADLTGIGDLPEKICVGRLIAFDKADISAWEVT